MKHGYRKIVVMLAFSIVVFVIAGLTMMTPEHTETLTNFYRDNFSNWLVYPKMKLFGMATTVRQGAHMYEYFLLGCGAMLLPGVKKMSLRAIRSWGICVIISNIDQFVKPILAGREYDPIDLVYDAIGYTAATVFIMLILQALHVIKRK